MIDKIFSLQYYAVEGRKRLVDADRSDRGIFDQGWGTGSRDQSYEFVAFETAIFLLVDSTLFWFFMMRFGCLVQGAF